MNRSNSPVVLEFIKLDKTDRYQEKYYKDAYNSYKKIYNEVMVRGKGELEPQSLMGNPIQLDLNNFNSLTNSEYFVSTKADGLRFLMIFSDGYQREQLDRLPGITQIGNEPNYRNIYFIDNQNNYWYINRVETDQQKQNSDYTGHLPGLLGIAKCLIDGELLFWGLVDKTFGDDGSIIKYTIRSTQETKPFIGFLAFDIMYGPTNPQFAAEKDVVVKWVRQGDPSGAPKEADRLKLEFGSSGAMLGFKGAERWPTEDRRQILETMFNNRYSHLIDYLRDLAKYDFTIMVSPFVPMEIMLDHQEPYMYMKRIFKEEIFKQCSNVGIVLQRTDASKKLFSHASELSEDRFNDVTKKNKKEGLITIDNYEEWVINEKKSKSIGKGIEDDGLIFTPKFKSYLIGPWTFCNNKQYKWKPEDQLTIDFKVGPLIETVGSFDNVIYTYEAKSRNDNEFKFRDKKCFIISDQELETDSIVETGLNQNSIGKDRIKFLFKQIRYDKKEPNAYRTMTSVMNAYVMFSAGINAFELISMMRNSVDIPEDTLKKIMSLLDPGILFKCMISMNFSDSIALLNPLLNQTNQVAFLKMIDRAKGNKNLELETRITFKTEHRPYGLCLVNQTIGRKYEPVPIIKAFGTEGSGYRSTYTNLGQELIYEKTQIKSDLENFNINVQKRNSLDETFFLYEQVQQVKVTLSTEKDIKMTPEPDMDEKSKENLLLKYLLAYGVKDTKKALESLKKINKPIEQILNEDLKSIENVPFKQEVFYNYQKRNVINNMSLFWRVDVIEYAAAENWKEAEERLNAGPSNEKDKDGHFIKGLGSRTRIEIEFDPASYYKDFLSYYRENPSPEAFATLTKLLGLDPENYKNKNVTEAADDFENSIEYYIQMLLETPSEEILADYMKVLSGILNAFYY